MRHCASLSPNRSSTTSDPRLNGIGHALEALYAPVLQAGLPEAWLHLLDRDGATRGGETERGDGGGSAGEPA
ncbi:hypothetical protein, partial [Methylobacterium sp. CCH5-D2]|uniref:hypothetical protein n=1 Tax=Methylobacterium sp. CCH5-D2 TaxID=1768765 RepID=UPI0012E358B2